MNLLIFVLKMMRIAWLSDIHLNFLYWSQALAFSRSVCEQDPDCLIITGDIGEADDVARYLQLLEATLQRPIYFVLGNHDYYGGLIAKVREEIKKLAASSEYLNWLPDSGVVHLTEHTCLIGHGSWGDGRFGDYHNSTFDLSDNHLIEDFINLSKTSRYNKLNELGSEAAWYFQKHLPAAVADHPHVIIATHVPPFRETSFYRKGLSGPHSLPYFACKSVGQVLKQFMIGHPDNKMTVLCGHTHSGGELQMLPNLQVKVSGARYYNPKIWQILEIM